MTVFPSLRVGIVQEFWVVILICAVLNLVVLSDPRKRKMYDAGLYDPDEEEDEVSDFEVLFSFPMSLVVFLLILLLTHRLFCNSGVF